MVKHQQQRFSFDDPSSADDGEQNPAATAESVSLRTTDDEEARGPAVGPDTDQVQDRSLHSDESTDDLKGQTVYVIDAHSLIYQVFHAMPDMSGPTGQPVGAIHGFVRDILDLLKNNKPNFCHRH